MSTTAERFSGRVSEWISWAENVLYFIVAAFLGVAAFILLGATAVGFVEYAAKGAFAAAVLHALEDLLLVVMLVEVTHTVGISLKRRVLVCEPFLIVGIVAAVRRILVITAEQVTPSEAKQVEFNMAMLELGIVTVMILALVAGIFMLRRAQRSNSSSPTSEQTENRSMI
ncbi:MAG: phosphate-starvation-inducible PsiE family protein [Opitutales bacterium]